MIATSVLTETAPTVLDWESLLYSTARNSRQRRRSRGGRMNRITISDFVEHLKTHPQNAEITFASVTAWTQDNELISWDTDHDLPNGEVDEE